MSETKQLVTPVGDLAWVFINGSSKKDLNGNDRYSAEVHFHKDSDEAKAIQAKVDEFWEDQKPKGRKRKSCGIRTVQEKDENNEYQDTDFISVQFWTGISFPDGSDKVIKIYNAKGSEVSLGSKKIGNGSRGCISGVMAIYDQGVAATGVTLYLNAIQLTKFVEFTGADAGFSAQETDDDGFEGIENEDGITPAEDEAAKPRL